MCGTKKVIGKQRELFYKTSTFVGKTLFEDSQFQDKVSSSGSGVNKNLQH